MKIKERIIACKDWITSERNLGTAIFFFAAVLSYKHTLAMFRRSGYTGIFEHVGTLAVEFLFLMGLIAVHRSHKSGQKTGQSKYAFFLGGAIVLWSNISHGLAHEKPIVFYRINEFWVIDEIMMIGIIIVAIVFVSEKVVAYSHRTDGQKVQTVEQTDRQEADGQTVRTDKEADTRTDESVRTEVSILDNTTVIDLGQTDEKENIALLLPPDSEADSKPDKVVRTLEKTSQAIDRTIRTDSKADIKIAKKKSPDSRTTRADGQTVPQLGQMKTGQPNRINHLLDADDPEVKRTVQIIFNYEDKFGKLPSVRTLADEADIKKHRSEKILKVIRAEREGE